MTNRNVMLLIYFMKFICLYILLSNILILITLDDKILFVDMIQIV